jgi:hypothetical protein
MASNILLNPFFYPVNLDSKKRGPLSIKAFFEHFKLKLEPNFQQFKK